MENLTFEQDIEQHENIQPQPGLLIILTGPTGAGKTTIGQELLRSPNIKRLVTFTTREPDKNEIEGVDYHFVKKEDFETMIAHNEFFEWVRYGDKNEYKGTPRNTLEQVLQNDGKDLLWIIDMSRAAQIEKTINQEFDPKTAKALLKRIVVILISTPRLTTLKDRHRQRNRDGTKLISRLKHDWQVWTSQKNKFPQIVINETGKLDEAVSQATAIIDDKRKEVIKRMKDQGKG